MKAGWKGKALDARRKLRASLSSARLTARGWWRSLRLPDEGPTNVFHASIQKTGSQWIKAVFGDPRIRRHTGLSVFPQRRYEWNEFRARFPRHSFVPGLYVPYGLYEEIRKPARYATFYVIRDPRDVVVSWYHSMLETHTPMGRVPIHRRRLRGRSFEEGIDYCIRELQLKFSFVRSWHHHGREDPDVLFVRFEDLVSEPVRGFDRIFGHCGLEVPTGLLEEVLDDYTKTKMRQRDLRRRSRGGSHYRRRGSDWREAFTEGHAELFRDTMGSLVEDLGYAW